MNTPLMPAELERLRSGHEVGIIDDIRNAYEIAGPFNAIDCDPNMNYGNFETKKKTNANHTTG